MIGALASVSSAEAAAPKGLHKGEAFGTSARVKVGPLSGKLGATAYLAMPCLGTDGAKQSSDIESISLSLVPGLLSAGTIVSTVQTLETSKKTTDEVISRIEGVSLFNGLISADGIVAVSRTTAGANAVESDNEGSSFVNLKIAGQEIEADVKANTQISLAGVGVVTLKKKERSGDGVNGSGLSIDMVSIEIDTDNAFGIPVGSVITIGHATSGFKRKLPDVVMSGASYAGYIALNVEGVANATTGALALQPLACEGTNGETLSQRVEGISLTGLATVKAGVSKAVGKKNVARTTSKVGRITLLGGLITASEIRAVARVAIVNGERVRSTEGSGFTDLRVLGLPIGILVGPNFRINLPTLGYVVINEQNDPGPNSKAETVVNGLKIVVTRNNPFGLPIGAKVIIAHAAAGIEKT